MHGGRHDQRAEYDGLLSPEPDGAFSGYIRVRRRGLSGLQARGVRRVHDRSIRPGGSPVQPRRPRRTRHSAGDHIGGTADTPCPTRRQPVVRHREDGDGHSDPGRSVGRELRQCRRAYGQRQRQSEAAAWSRRVVGTGGPGSGPCGGPDGHSMVGNYGEIYDRHLGSDGLGLPRGRNALWADAPCVDCPKGGQIYAPPLR